MRAHKQGLKEGMAVRSTTPSRQYCSAKLVDVGHFV
jgi:hypothetical protein